MEPLKFKIQNVFCIPLKSMNEQQLFAVSESYTIAFDALIEIKKSGFDKIWVEKGGDYMIAYEVDGEFSINEMYCPVTKKERDSIIKINPIKSPKMPKDESLDKKGEHLTNLEEVSEVEEEVILDIDVILEKISKVGIKALREEEKNFLDSKSKE